MGEKMKLLLLVWTIGFWGGVLFWFLRITGRIRIEGYRKGKFASGNRGLVLISNHSSLWEPVLLPFLFFPWYLVSLKFIPYSTPDKRNYYQKSWFLFLRPVCIPIERENKRDELKTLERLREMAQEGKILILFPEAGRTFKGTEFRFSKSGRKIRRFPSGVRKLFTNMNTNFKVLPVWVEGGERVIPNQPEFPRHFPRLRLLKRVRMIIGETAESESVPKDKERINEYLENILLKPANQKVKGA